jgi:amino acid transporter
MLTLTPVQIHPKYQAPVNAVYCTGGFSFILSLIYIGSPTAFYAITSLMTVALLQCYMFSIGSILWRRIVHPETLPQGTFMAFRLMRLLLFGVLWSFVSSPKTGEREES